MPSRAILEVIAWLEDLFGRHGVQRSYGGAIARNFHALPRMTKDVDVLALLSQLEIPKFVEDLVSAGASALVVDEDTGLETERPLDLRRFLDDLRSPGRMTRFLCFGVRVRLFVPWHPFDHEVLGRAQTRELQGHEVRVHTPEDLIVYKIAFGRSKDIEDVKAILAAGANPLDLERIRDAATRLLDEPARGELESLIRDDCR